eukprot:gnl/MRDRNA2_/MRDRNA2_88696_c0_seq1.p1 gnl/MRDRNA2_/MRDRNA2_88696_c0~~gnl/MRDRNA2_/MRDRNA2_88696_c0_seq1.p1  ORF type:complete len:343 (+),score=73.78 gnl/MRDRNA2_/MRDRNA2_88696_c0_seq1:71-1099(+)
MQGQAVRPSPREPRHSHAQKGKQGSDLTQGKDVASAPLPALLNRPENMAKKKTKCSECNIDEAHLILSKHTALGYIAFLTADSQIQKDAQAQFAGVRENYHLSHPVGLVLTYATLCKYYPDAPADKVLQMWKQAVEDWQTLGDGTRKLWKSRQYDSHGYKELEHFYGRDERTFDKEKTRKSLLESYLQREQKMRLLASQAGKQPFIQAVNAFTATAFENVMFEEVATNDILLNTMFLVNAKNALEDDAVKREQFQREKSAKYVDFPAKQKELQRVHDEPDEMDLYLAQLEAQNAKDGRHNARKNPREDRDPKKALAQTGGMLLVRGMQGAVKRVGKAIVKPM